MTMTKEHKLTLFVKKEKNSIPYSYFDWIIYIVRKTKEITYIKSTISR